jgi:hypothetical protein
MTEQSLRPPAALLAIPALLASVAFGCSGPVLSKDGQLVFPQGGAHGASVLTANGVEFLDRAQIPQPVVRRSADEPWRPATGFLIPASGVWRSTSIPMPIEGHGLAVVLRSSDELVPSWGGEILLRLDVIAPAAAFPAAAASVRAPLRLAIVLDGPVGDTAALVAAAIENSGASDRVGLILAGPRHPVLPPIAGSHRTLLTAAVERLIAQSARSPVRGPDRDLAGALALARQWLTVSAPGDSAAIDRRVLVLSDGVGAASGGAPLAREVAALASASVQLVAVGATRLDPAALAALGDGAHAGGSLDERSAAVEAAVPAPGDVVLDDVELTVASVPAPAHVIESSGGQSALGLDRDRLLLGELYAGEARTEVVRLALPAWVPGEPLDLTVAANYRDTASGSPQTAFTTIHCRYSADIEQIAEARRGDVIAYASALAMVRRLHRAFLGSDVDRLGGLRPMAALQARSLVQLSKTNGDPALWAQAEVLSTLLGVVEE